jgi:glucosamine-6-phosphate isomerase
MFATNIKAENRHFLNGTTRDPEAECLRYEREIADAGGIDLQVLGIGTNGHIGFNEPAPTLVARAHRVRLRPETRRSNASLFGGDAENVPAEALSVGMATILHSRAIVLLATGRSKAACIERVVNGPLTPELPASFLQLHDGVDIMLDAPAAEKLQATPGVGIRFFPNRLAHRVVRLLQATQRLGQSEIGALHDDGGFDVPLRALQQLVGGLVVDAADEHENPSRAILQLF